MGVQLTGESMQKQGSNFDYGFFKLEQNHDKAIVRFLHEGYEDFSRRPVHYVRVPDKKFRIAINCLRGDNDSETACPLCSCSLTKEQVGKRSKRIYVEFLVYQILDRNGAVKKDFTSAPKRMVWERDRRFDDKIFSLASRFTPLCDTVFQVERFGEAGSTNTEYDIYPISVDNNAYKFELPDKLYNPDGVQVLDKNYDEMNYYIENGSFPPADNAGNNVQRRADVAQTEQQYQAPVQNTIPQGTIIQPIPVQSTTPVQQPVAPATVTISEQPIQQAQPTSRRRSI